MSVRRDIQTHLSKHKAQPTCCSNIVFAKGSQKMEELKQLVYKEYFEL